MMKVKAILVTLCLFIALFTGCAKTGTDEATPTPTTAVTAPTTAPTTAATTTAPTTAATATTAPDAVTTASIVDTESAFENAISKNGTWIIAILKDLTINKDLVLDGEFKNGKKDDSGKDIIQRKIALYTQDENRNITARFTLTAPKLTINSPEASIQHGTFKGDLYVAVINFKLIDATVDGNIYFTSKDIQSSFTMDESSSVTGKQELAK